MEKNPFKVLGILPEALVGLSDEAIRKIVEVAYRFRANLHHPDKGGDENKFREVAWAAEQLSERSSRATYLEWKRRAIKRPKNSPLVKAQSSYLEAALEVVSTEDNLRRLWRTFLLGAEKRQSFGDHAFAPDLSVFNLKPCRFIVADAAAHLVSLADGSAATSLRMPKGRERGFAEFVYDGKLWTKYPVERERYSREKGPAPEYATMVYLAPDGPGHSYCYLRAGNAVTIDSDLRVIGSVVGAVELLAQENVLASADSAAKLSPLALTYERSQLLSTLSQIESQFRKDLVRGLSPSVVSAMAQRDGFPWNRFAPLEKLISPVLRRGAMLVGAKLVDPSKPTFFLLGNVVLSEW